MGVGGCWWVLVGVGGYWRVLAGVGGCSWVFLGVLVGFGCLNEAKNLKRKEAKNYCFCFAKRCEKEAKRFLFRFVLLQSEKKISENGTP